MAESYASEHRLLPGRADVVRGISGMRRRDGVDVADGKCHRAGYERREVHAVEVGGVALRRLDILGQLHPHKIRPAGLASVDQMAEMRGDRRHVYGRTAESSVERH